MSQITVRGSFTSGRDARDFEKTVEAVNENVAVEHVYAELGSEHGLKRTQIEITEVNA
ncbi:MAG: 50S ribosomal protein L18Ae [Halobacteriales archaeon]|nr:50S ribosomal protein L18Ae [Halobacteriales archaeon]